MRFFSKKINKVKFGTLQVPRRHYAARAFTTRTYLVWQHEYEQGSVASGFGQVGARQHILRELDTRQVFDVLVVAVDHVGQRRLLTVVRYSLWKNPLPHLWLEAFLVGGWLVGGTRGKRQKNKNKHR